MRKLTSFTTALFVAVHFGAPASAADNAEIEALRTELRTLQQHILVLERKQELRDDEAAASPAPKITINDRGFTLASNDGANVLRLRGLVQLDARQFFDDGGDLTPNAFVLRRARLISEGQFARNFGFQFITEFGGSNVSILDANLTAAVTPDLQVKIGKFKSPIGLEQLQSDAWTFFNERSLVTTLVPNRDLGIQLQGTLLQGRVSYQAGVFNGVADGASSNNSDLNDDKDIAGRIIAAPFSNDGGSVLPGLSFGIAGSIGREKTANGRASAYRTDGQQTFFSYRADTLAHGRSWRFAPQADIRSGSFGALGEYVISAVNLRAGATSAVTELQNKGWQFAAGYVLTGENSSYSGVVPRSHFDWGAGTWGAFEIVARYARIQMDADAFPTFASPTTSAKDATSFGIGLNWYLSRAALVKFDYYQTSFGLSPHAPATSTTTFLHRGEKALITRFQLTF